MEELIKEVEFIRDTYLKNHPEEAEKMKKEEIDLKRDYTPEEILQLVEEAKNAAKSEILNSTIRDQMLAVIEDIGESFKPQPINPLKTTLQKSTLTE